MSKTSLRPVAAAAIILILTTALMPGGAAGAAHSAKHIHHAVLRVSPRCVSVRPHEKKKMTVTFTHGVRGVRYSFALVPLFGRGGFVGPGLGGYRADRFGTIRFTYPAPNKKAEAGRWQLTATRRVGRNSFKAAALTHFTVKRGKCKRR